eukprot:scaffold16360_cov88-Skeletonema_menzelii.AAC.2
MVVVAEEAPTNLIRLRIPKMEDAPTVKRMVKKLGIHMEPNLAASMRLMVRLKKVSPRVANTVECVTITKMNTMRNPCFNAWRTAWKANVVVSVIIIVTTVESLARVAGLALIAHHVAAVVAAVMTAIESLGRVPEWIIDI